MMWIWESVTLPEKSVHSEIRQNPEKPTSDGLAIPTVVQEEMVSKKRTKN